MRNYDLKISDPLNFFIEIKNRNYILFRVIGVICCMHLQKFEYDFVLNPFGHIVASVLDSQLPFFRFYKFGLLKCKKQIDF
jgi:hypothetical protein